MTCFFVFQNMAISQIHEVYNFTNFCSSVFPGKVSTNSSMSKNMNITYNTCAVSVSTYVNLSKGKPHQLSKVFQNPKLWGQVIYISSKIPQVFTYFTAHARYKNKCEVLNLKVQQEQSTMTEIPGFLYIYDFCTREGTTLSDRSIYDLTSDLQQGNNTNPLPTTNLLPTNPTDLPTHFPTDPIHPILLSTLLPTNPTLLQPTEQAPENTLLSIIETEPAQQ